MFEKLAEKLQSWAATREKFDPSSIGDPLAMKTEWTPVKSGGASFRTHELVQIESHRIDFNATMGSKVFCSAFFLMGMVFIIGFSAARWSSGKFSFSIELIMPVLFGLVFAIIGVCMYYFSNVPIVFDKYKGCFWKDRKVPDGVGDRQEIKYYERLDDIYALQIISEHCRSSKSSYYSYELNLVLKNGSRINVVDHGNLEKLREDARILSEFLGKPIWDAVLK